MAVDKRAPSQIDYDKAVESLDAHFNYVLKHAKLGDYGKDFLKKSLIDLYQNEEFRNANPQERRQWMMPWVEAALKADFVDERNFAQRTVGRLFTGSARDREMEDIIQNIQMLDYDLKQEINTRAGKLHREREALENVNTAFTSISKLPSSLAAALGDFRKHTSGPINEVFTQVNLTIDGIADNTKNTLQELHAMRTEKLLGYMDKSPGIKHQLAEIVQLNGFNHLSDRGLDDAVNAIKRVYAERALHEKPTLSEEDMQALRRAVEPFGRTGGGYGTDEQREKANQGSVNQLMDAMKKNHQPLASTIQSLVRQNEQPKEIAWDNSSLPQRSAKLEQSQ